MAVVIKGSGSIEGSSGLEMGANGTTEIRGQVNVAVGSSVAGVSTATGFVPTQGQLSHRNLIINGAMKVAQRGDVTGVEYGYGGCDRWRFSGGSAARITMKQGGAGVSPTDKGFGFCQHFDVTTADASLAAGDYNMLSYKWEGQDLPQIKKGTAAAESLTVSFWVSSPKTGTHIVELYDQANSRQISKAYTVSTADTWEKKTVTFAGDTTGTITNDAAARLILEFWLCAGSTYSSGTLNTSWAAITNANRAVGQVNTMDNTSNNFKLTGVQVELGSVDTPFEHVSYGESLRKCQRYFQHHFSKENEGQTFGTRFTTQAQGGITYYTALRAAPTATLKGINIHVMSTGGNVDVTSMNMTIGGTNVTTQTSLVALVTAGSLVQGEACLAHGNAGDDPMGIWLDSEI